VKRTALAVALLATATCSDLDHIDVEATGEAVIPQRTVLDELLGQVSFAGFGSFDISQTQEFQNQGYTKDQIDSVRLRRLTLEIADPPGASFDFLDSVRFSVEADGLPPVEIAHLDSVPAGSNELALEVAGDVELTPYVVAPSMRITNDATGTRPAQETTVRATAVFDVDVSLTGACK
jgi:hypothetical protein